MLLNQVIELMGCVCTQNTMLLYLTLFYSAILPLIVIAVVMNVTWKKILTSSFKKYSRFVFVLVHTYVHHCVYSVQEGVCTHLCAPLCIQDNVRCVQQYLQKTNTKPLPPTKLRKKRGIMSKMEPEDRKSPE